MAAVRRAIGHGARVAAGSLETASCPPRRACALPGGRETPAYMWAWQDKRSLELVPDDDLLRRLVEILGQSRRVEADLVALIGEVDARRLYAREASPSMFAFCTETLHLSEAAAYLRIAAARASRKHPVLLTLLASGRLHLTAIAKLAPHLTPENRDRLLERAVHRTKRQVEELVARSRPGRMPRRWCGGCRNGARRPRRRAAPPRLRPPATPPPVTSATPGPAAPDPAAGSAPSRRDRRTASRRSRGLPIGTASRRSSRKPAQLGPGRAAPPETLEPLAPALQVQFTAGAELRDKLDRLRALMRSSVPDGDLAAIIDAAVTEKLERLEARRSVGRRLPARGLPWPRSRLPHATSRQRSGGPSTSGTAADAATSTTRVGDAALARGSSSITGTRSRWAAAIRLTRWACSVEPTMASWPRSTSVERPWRGTAAPTPRPGRPR